MMGSKPQEEEIPVEMSDFPDLLQSAFNVYSYLRDDWDLMNGNYLGKHRQGIEEIFNILGIDGRQERKMILEFLVLIDSARVKQIASSKPKEKNKTPNA